MAELVAINRWTYRFQKNVHTDEGSEGVGLGIAFEAVSAEFLPKQAAHPIQNRSGATPFSSRGIESTN